MALAQELHEQIIRLVAAMRRREPAGIRRAKEYIDRPPHRYAASVVRGVEEVVGVGRKKRLKRGGSRIIFTP